MIKGQIMGGNNKKVPRLVVFSSSFEPKSHRHRFWIVAENYETGVEWGEDQKIVNEKEDGASHLGEGEGHRGAG